MTPNATQIRLHVLVLWQTAILRLTKLAVRDEVNEALRYYEMSLLDQVPTLHAAFERLVHAHLPERVEPVAPVVRMGFLDRRRPRRQPVRDG